MMKLGRILMNKQKINNMVTVISLNQIIFFKLYRTMCLKDGEKLNMSIGDDKSHTK
jgi:hypothetical protein